MSELRHSVIGGIDKGRTDKERLEIMWQTLVDHHWIGERMTSSPCAEEVVESALREYAAAQTSAMKAMPGSEAQEMYHRRMTAAKGRIMALFGEIAQAAEAKG